MKRRFRNLRPKIFAELLASSKLQSTTDDFVAILEQVIFRSTQEPGLTGQNLTQQECI